MAASTAYAQQAAIEGQIFIHNSEYSSGKLEYVEGAYISAPNATTQATNRKGIFRLELAGVDAGNALAASVEKAGLEVVNPGALHGIAAGGEAPLRIFMLEKGRLEQAQKELLGSSLGALTKRYEALAATLRQGGADSRNAIIELEKQFNREIATRFEAEHVLARHREELKERLPDRAGRLARLNLDFASALCRQAFEQYKLGNMEQAAALLDDVALEREGQVALATLEEMERKGKSKQAIDERERLRQLVQCYQLKTQACLPIFQYREALNASLKGVMLLENAGGREDIEYSEALDAVALNYLLRGEYPDALHYQRKSTMIKEQLLGPDSPEVASAYDLLAAIYRNVKEYEAALEAQEKAVAIKELALPATHSGLAVSYTGLSDIYKAMGTYEMALDARQKAIQAQERALPPYHPDIARSYQSLAEIHLDGGAHMKALEAQLKTLFLQEQSLPANHPDVDRSYNSLARIYLKLGDYDKALTIQQKILGLQEQSLPAGHPDIADSYHNIASTFYFLNDLDRALEHEHQAYAMLKEQLPPYHPRIKEVEASFAFLYTTRGERRQAAGRYTEAVQDLKNALEFQPDNPEARKRIKQIEAGQMDEQETFASKGNTSRKPAPQRNSRVETRKEEPAPAQNFGLFQVTKATSFRERPASSSKVLRRLAPGDRLQVVEKTEYYWWKVVDNGRVGYVKALLLEKVD